jgi:hypothetical protein
MSESERPALRKARISAAPACGGVSASYAEKSAMARWRGSNFRADAVGEETVDHVGAFGELNVEPRMNGRAIDAAVEDRPIRGRREAGRPART